MRGDLSGGVFTRMARDTHPVDLMCLYLLHGSVERIPGLLAAPGPLSLEHLRRQVPAGSRWSHDDADTFSLGVEKTVRGRSYGFEFRVHFVGGEPYADAVVPFGASVDLYRFLRHFRGHYASDGDWSFDVYTDVRDLRESVVLFGNRREVWFQVNRGRVVAGGSKPVPGGRLIAGRLHGNQFGASAGVLHAGSVMFPDRADAVAGTSAQGRAYRRYVARLRDPLPLGVRRRGRPEFGSRT
ncbi:hypothetical protein [Streptomyces sp. 4F14]|uniref:hypothetical protein n=1 Tax=Streptomyces sp. 4F14 TaxID=3394380 RepID=UPI003A8371B7